MRYTSKQLKAISRTQLTGKYGILGGAFLLYEVITSLLSMILNIINPSVSTASITQTIISGESPSLPGVIQSVTFIISYVIILLIASVVSLGFNKMFLDVSREYPVRFEDLFYGFRHHPDRVIVMQLILLGINFLCYLPALIVWVIWFYQDFSSIPLMLAALVLFLIGLAAQVYFTLTFQLSMFLMADYDDLGPVQALKESHKLMTGNKGRALYIELSFIGFMILGFLTCSIGYLWIFPYMYMTRTNLYRNITGEI